MSNQPTKKDRLHWQSVRELGCIICRAYHVEIHHALTGMGGRKDHAKVLPLCKLHHTGDEGIHKLGRKAWASKFGRTEQEWLDLVSTYLNIDQRL